MNLHDVSMSTDKAYYHESCAECGKEFVGYKRQIFCDECQIKIDKMEAKAKDWIKTEFGDECDMTVNNFKLFYEHNLVRAFMMGYRAYEKELKDTFTEKWNVKYSEEK